MKKSLQSSEYVLTLLTACIKKNGGEIKLTEQKYRTMVIISC